MTKKMVRYNEKMENNNQSSNPTTSYNSTYLAISYTVPTVGSQCECRRLDMVDNNWKFKTCKTEVIKSVQQIGHNTYKVKTSGFVYIIAVI